MGKVLVDDTVFPAIADSLRSVKGETYDVVTTQTETVDYIIERTKDTVEEDGTTNENLIPSPYKFESNEIYIPEASKIKVTMKIWMTAPYGALSGEVGYLYYGDSLQNSQNLSSLGSYPFGGSTLTYTANANKIKLSCTGTSNHASYVKGFWMKVEALNSSGQVMQFDRTTTSVKTVPLVVKPRDIAGHIATLNFMQPSNNTDTVFIEYSSRYSLDSINTVTTFGMTPEEFLPKVKMMFTNDALGTTYTANWMYCPALFNHGDNRKLALLGNSGSYVDIPLKNGERYALNINSDGERFINYNSTSFWFGISATTTSRSQFYYLIIIYEE